jgi:hypothetical protein
MKKQLLFKLISASLLFFIYINTKAQNSKSLSNKNSSSSILNGAWKMVSDNVNGHITLAKDQPLKIYVLCDGFWMWYGPDSTGNWNRGGAGTYEITDNIWKQKAVYSYDPDLIGTINWSRFEMKGDTLYMQNYVKLIYHGEDQTAGSPKREVKWIRYKD